MARKLQTQKLKLCNYYPAISIFDQNTRLAFDFEVLCCEYHFSPVGLITFQREKLVNYLASFFYYNPQNLNLQAVRDVNRSVRRESPAGKPWRPGAISSRPITKVPANKRNW